MNITIDGWFWVGGVIAIVLGYILIKLSFLQLQIKNVRSIIPTTDKLAKEILKTKIPISEVPPEVLEAYKKLPKQNDNMSYVG